MRQEKMTLSLFLMGTLLAGLVALAAQMCLNEAFSLGADPRLLITAAVAGGLGATALMCTRRMWPSLAAAAAVAAVALWQAGTVASSFLGILRAVSELFAACYSFVPVLGTAGGNPAWVLMLLALPLAWVTAWVVCREGSVAAVFLVSAPVLLLCLMIVDVAPVFWLVLLTAVLLLLLLTQSVRTNSSREGGRLSWWLVLPTVILVAAITVLWPPADYVRADWSDTLQTLAEAKLSLQRLGTTILYRGPGWNSSLKTVDLSVVGPRAQTGRAVLSYSASTKLDYLRGVSLGVYENNTWSAIPQSDYTAQSFAIQPQLSLGLNGDREQYLQVTTYASLPVLYTAYGLSEIPDFGQAVDDAYLANRENRREYQISYNVVRGDAGDALDAYDAFVYEHYLQIPKELQEPLEEILDAAGLRAASAAEAIAAWVRELGTYDLNTPAVPAGEDFVLYFLTQSQRGYCVHFASATVLLMRALGIPARYVTGYAVSGAAGESRLVTEDNAHAWVEYYVSGVGWVPVDPTPAEALTATEPEKEEEVQATTEPEEEVQPEETPPQEKPAPSEEPDTPETPGEAEGMSGSQTHDSSSKEQPDLRWLWLLTLPGAAGLIWLRRVLVLRSRLERCRRGNPNRRALTLWRWLCHLSKADGVPLDESLYALAEKARFSQHTLTEEELQLLQKARNQRIEVLRTRPWRIQLWDRYGRVLY